ncbi:hypothetical protein [Acholeplasma laidlawii]|uniref:hypothetical protein n=1 Tax=Acholeplasma laidlawii TaxID=2148 RepID=UPI0021F7465F|nr:hypothetical protein [Acholeplasma laidlawii]
MKVKKFLISFSFTILFGVLSIGSLILYIFGKSNYDLFQAIITGISSIFFMVLTIKGNYYDSYYIAYNQKYFLNGINIFEDSIMIKEKKIIRYKKFLKDKVTKSTYSLVYNKTLDLHFIVYELKNNFQLITIKNTGFTHTGLYFDETDRLLNTDVLIEKIGIKQLEGVNYIKKYTSNDEKVYYSFIKMTIHLELLNIPIQLTLHIRLVIYIKRCYHIGIKTIMNLISILITIMKLKYLL